MIIFITLRMKEWKEKECCWKCKPLWTDIKLNLKDRCPTYYLVEQFELLEIKNYKEILHENKKISNCYFFAEN